MKTIREKILARFGMDSAGAFLWVCVVAFGLCTVVGCKKSGAETAQFPQNSQLPYDDSGVAKAFSNAPPASQSFVLETVSEAEHGGAADALPQLSKIAADSRLTAEQKAAINDFIQQIQSNPKAGK